MFWVGGVGPPQNGLAYIMFAKVMLLPMHPGLWQLSDALHGAEQQSMRLVTDPHELLLLLEGGLAHRPMHCLQVLQICSKALVSVQGAPAQAWKGEVAEATLHPFWLDASHDIPA